MAAVLTPDPTPWRRPAPAAVFRRRRLGAAGALGLLVMGAGSVLGRVSPPAVPALVSDRVYVVQPGDTIWGIARRLQPSGDVRPTVDRLVADHGAVLRAGERLRVPAGR